SSPKDQSLFIVAGPGSGKTTVMVLKILKFIFVDDVSPNEILATTFTRKAASELLSRILSWGDKIKSKLIANYMEKMFSGEITDDSIIKEINRIDFNQINIGTIDSIADELLRIYRQAGTSQPILIEDFVANSVMINECLLKDDRYKHDSLQEYLAEITGKQSNTEHKPKVKNLTMMASILIEIKEHIYYNMVDINKILTDIQSTEIGKQMALNLILEYAEILKSQNIYDFAMLETEFLRRLNSDSLDVFLNDIKIILVDEYQDTNLLQESIYFKIAESAIKNGGNITVVGDDDQSLYRFRGASVDLFTNFIERIGRIGIEAREVNLKTNYRSTENIIDLCNDFVELDDEYQSARVKEKPKIEVPSFNEDDSNQVPILGMFRNNEQLLATDLAKFIDELNRNGIVKRKIKRVLTKEDNQKFNSDNKTTLINYRDKGFELAEGEDEIVIELGDEGSAEDIAFLTYSPKELTATGSRTFAFALKKQLGRLRHPIDVFNPRGQDLQNIDCVAVFCGLMLECIDPNSNY
ncbi:MAG: ATP-dependent helicase, partial [Methanobrevibacter sp.]|nr:ATP-dependent helicase [Methanobrevibacter sp.]